MKEEIRSLIPTECPWRDTLYWFDATDSTNSQAKGLARQGAAHGTVVLAGLQTQGRGRLGRSFCSPAGQGVYLSVILRPGCRPDALMHLTCAAGVAMARAIERCCGLGIGLKWINDLVYDRKKLGGILTELSVDSATGLVEWAIVGIGINCLQKDGDFPTALKDIATSLAMATGKEIAPETLAAAMVEALWEMDRALLPEKSDLMARYRGLCITLGQPVCAVRGEEQRYGTALDITDDGALLLQLADGTVDAIHSGEVSIRGMYGYL